MRTVVEEWTGHVIDLRRIADMLESRPTTDSSDQIEALRAIASSIEWDAKEYAEG